MGLVAGINIETLVRPVFSTPLAFSFFVKCSTEIWSSSSGWQCMMKKT